MRIELSPEPLVVPHDISIVWRALNHPNVDAPVDEDVSVYHDGVNIVEGEPMLGITSETKYIFKLSQVESRIARKVAEACINAKPLVLKVEEFGPPTNSARGTRVDRAKDSIFVSDASYIERRVEPAESGALVVVQADIEIQHLPEKLRTLATKYDLDPRQEFARQVTASLGRVAIVADELAQAKAAM